MDAEDVLQWRLKGWAMANQLDEELSREFWQVVADLWRSRIVVLRGRRLEHIVIDETLY